MVGLTHKLLGFVGNDFILVASLMVDRKYSRQFWQRRGDVPRCTKRGLCGRVTPHCHCGSAIVCFRLGLLDSLQICLTMRPMKFHLIALSNGVYGQTEENPLDYEQGGQIYILELNIR
jgi:hypothetical protein